MTRPQRRFTQFTRPVFPSPVAPGMEQGALGLLPRASNPAVTSDARQGGDRPQAQAQDYAVDIGQPSNPRVHSHCATPCRNQGLDYYSTRGGPLNTVIDTITRHCPAGGTS